MDGLRMGPLHLNYFLGHRAGASALMKPAEKKIALKKSAFLFEARHHPRLAVDKEIASLSFSISVAFLY